MSAQAAIRETTLHGSSAGTRAADRKKLRSQLLGMVRSCGTLDLDLTSDIERKLCLTTRQLRRLVAELVKDGLLTETATGRYAVAPKRGGRPARATSTEHVLGVPLDKRQRSVVRALLSQPESMPRDALRRRCKVSDGTINKLVELRVLQVTTSWRLALSTAAHSELTGARGRS